MLLIIIILSLICTNGYAQLFKGNKVYFVSTPFSILIQDFNEDERLDLSITGQKDGQMSIFQNFNNDGKEDIASANWMAKIYQ